MNARLIEALSSIAPTSPGVYAGDATTYITFNYTTDAVLYADNAPMAQMYRIQVHYFLPTLAASLVGRERVQRALYSAGFEWPSETDATDGNGQHYVYECSCVEGLEV